MRLQRVSWGGMAALVAVTTLVVGGGQVRGPGAAVAQNVGFRDPRVDALAGQMNNMQGQLNGANKAAADARAQADAVARDLATYKTTVDGRLYRIESSLLPFGPPQPGPVPPGPPNPGPVPGPVPPNPPPNGPPVVPTGAVWAVYVRADPPTLEDTALRRSSNVRAALPTTGAYWHSYLVTEPEMRDPRWAAWVAAAGGPPCVLWVTRRADGQGSVIWTTPQPDEAKVLATYKAIRGK